MSVVTVLWFGWLWGAEQTEHTDRAEESGESDKVAEPPFGGD